MNKFKNFLSSFWYIIAIAFLSYLTWIFKFFFTGNLLINITFTMVLILSLIFGLILLLFDNTIYSIPIALSLLFSIGITGIDINTISVAALGFVSAAVIILSIVIHMFKFKVKIKLNNLGIGFILVAASFLIPLLYRGLTKENSLVSFLGPIYLLIYLFYSNTIKKDQISYLFRTLFIMSFLLSFQLIAIFVFGIIDCPEPNLYKAILHMIPRWDVNIVGWGNINDLTIHLILFSSSAIYYMRKFPTKIFPWLQLLFISFVIVVSFARGSMVALALLWGVVFILSIKYRKIGLLKKFMVTLLSILLILIIFNELTVDIINNFLNSLNGGANNMLSGRLTLYQYAIEAFKNYPFFGSGWGDLDTFNNHWSGYNRIVVYHSTFFHVLATGGIFGILILIFHLYQIFKLLFTHRNFAKIAIAITYIITQLHGLFDNTQYMLNYTISTIIIFAVLEIADRFKEENTLAIS